VASGVRYAQSGAVRALATYGRKRSPSSPNVPTINEHGYDFESGSIYLILGPAGLPPNVVQKLEIAFTKGTETTEFKTAQEAFYLTAIYYDSKGCDRYLIEQWVKTEKIFKDTAIIKEAATQPY
jgi:tripartite-type tricarboxylate transporter receptor subunit TctC